MYECFSAALLSWLFECQIVNMLQLKVFYNVSFPEGERCEVIFTDQNIQSFEELMEVVRGKIECLRFIPDSELRVQYVDDENTLINLRANDSFMDALRCAVTVPGATFHRLKVNILWQPKSTPEMISKKRQEMRASTTTCTGKNNRAELKDPLKKQLNFENPESPAVFDKEMEASALKDTPVDRMLSKKRTGVEVATKALEHAKVQKDNFERELSRAAFHNSGSLSMCGKCHFKVGHTRRNCDGDECTSAMLCGVIDKHPNDKAVRRNLSQQVTKCETELANLKSDYNSKLSAYKTVENSFARKIEADIVASNPGRYIVNGVKNWALLNKHVALLQKKCNGKLPRRHSVVNLLKEAVEEHELKSQRLHAKERFVNPKKHILEDEYAIRFPKRTSSARACSSSSFPGSSLLSAGEESDFRIAVPRLSPSTSSSSSTFSGSPFMSAEEESDFRMAVPRHTPSTASSSSTFSGSQFLSAEEESDFRMAVRLQAELNNQTLCGGSTAHEEINYCGMFVPGQGWKAPTSEPESSAQREEEAANALVQLQRNNIPENTH